MTFGVKLHVWGDYACFTRPEMKVERVSYDVITPSAARGILEAIHWKPAIRWQIDRIHVLKPIRFQSFRRNEVGSKISASKARSGMNNDSLEGLHLLVDDDRQQRATIALRDVAYVIEAHFEMTNKAESGDNVGKHADMFTRRARTGQCYHRPCLGVREFAADFALIEGAMPDITSPQEDRDKDLGWMLYDIDFANDMTPHFFRAQLKDGTIDLVSVRPKVFGS
ncbi:MAG: type I-C CRISPR-associated protein Cas5c [Alphaproteobacteria bacterium]|nr:type I-C CRISPR-associated protein Cas5c [Alphaproteobacteria bacterium]